MIEIWQQHRWSMLLITHDIREAVRLSAEVLVLSTKPTRTIGGAQVDRAMPRDDEFVADPRARDLEHVLLDLLDRAGTGSR